MHFKKLKGTLFFTFSHIPLSTAQPVHLSSRNKHFMKSFFTLLILLFILLAFFSSLGVVYYVNNSVQAERIETK